MTTIREVAEQRAKFRSECRVAADKLLNVFLAELDKVPEDQQGHVVTMLMTELQIATRTQKKTP